MTKAGKLALARVAAGVIALCGVVAAAEYTRVYMAPLRDRDIAVEDKISITHYCSGTIIDSTREFGIVGVLARTSAESAGSVKETVKSVYVSTRSYFGGKWKHTFSVRLVTEFLGEYNGHTDFLFSVWRTYADGQSEVYYSDSPVIIGGDLLGEERYQVRVGLRAVDGRGFIISHPTYEEFYGVTYQPQSIPEALDITEATVKSEGGNWKFAVFTAGDLEELFVTHPSNVQFMLFFRYRLQQRERV
jgi:hypothetical protein